MQERYSHHCRHLNATKKEINEGCLEGVRGERRKNGAQSCWEGQQEPKAIITCLRHIFATWPLKNFKPHLLSIALLFLVLATVVVWFLLLLLFVYQVKQLNC